jgi:hypothetical protein
MGTLGMDFSLTGEFQRFVGETLAELRRQDVASIDGDLLNLKRSHLAEKLKDFKRELEVAVKREKGRAEQDLISRGLANTTIRPSLLRGIESDASNESDKATREYNRAIEEIALLERKVNGSRTKRGNEEEREQARKNEMTDDAHQRLSSLRDELARLEPWPWNNIAAWSAKATPIIRTDWPDHFDDFNKTTTKPRFTMAASAWYGGQSEEEALKQDNENRLRAQQAKERILGFLEGLLAVWNHSKVAAPTAIAKSDPITVRRQILRAIADVQSNPSAYIPATAIAERLGLGIEGIEGHLEILHQDGKVSTDNNSSGCFVHLTAGQRQRFRESILPAAHRQVPEAVRSQIIGVICDVQGNSPSQVISPKVISDRLNIGVDEIEGHLEILGDDSRINFSPVLGASMTEGQMQRFQESQHNCFTGEPLDDTYEQIAARLLHVESFPLLLPPLSTKNIGGLSDEDEQHLCAKVCELTTGLTEHRWRELTEEQRIGWMKVAGSRLETRNCMTVPPEITDSLKQFRNDHPELSKVAFIMMRFGSTTAHSVIVESIRSALRPLGIAAVRADDKHYHDDLWPNILTYVYGCEFGIAVFERLEQDDFNPNVSLEVGYLYGLGKPVCLLKDKTLKTLHTDLVGKLYRPFDPQDPKGTIPTELAKWLKDKGIME